MKPIVFTDLDGSLPDHESYSCEEARPALNLLQEKNIPVIANTVKHWQSYYLLENQLVTMTHLL